MHRIGGVMQGHVTQGSRVIWRGNKFGLPTTHHTLITGYAEPYSADVLGRMHAEFVGQCVAWFQDTQEKGRFAFFQHDHFFRESRDEAGQPITTLEDEVHFRMPFGPLGAVVGRLLLEPHIRTLARQRFAMLKDLAEGEDWREWATPSPLASE